MRWQVIATSDARQQLVGFRSPRCRCRSRNWRRLWAPCSSSEAHDKSGLRSSERTPPYASATSCARSMNWETSRASRGWLAGQLHIGMIPTIAPYLLPTVIGNLTRMHPELDVHVREALTSRLIQELVEGRLDTAIVALPVSEPSLTEVALFAENFLLVWPGEDEGTPVPTSETLREMRLLLLEEGNCFRDQALSFCNMQSP